MHEIATNSDCLDDARQCPAGEALLGADAPLTLPHINALSACLAAIEGIFDVFLSLDVHTIRCLPVFNFVRVAYAVVVLMKLYFAASLPKSELGKVINKDNMKVEQYLESLVDKFRAAAIEDRSRPAAKFLFVLVTIRSWFQKQKQNQSQNGGSNPCATAAAATTETPPPSYTTRHDGRDKGTPTPAPPQLQQPDFSAAASTPLQLLSEVATNNSAAASRPLTSADLLPSGAGASGQGNPAAPSWLKYEPNPTLSSSSRQQPATSTPAEAGNVPLPFLTPTTAAQQQQQQQQLQQQQTLIASAPPVSVANQWLGNPFLAGGDFDYSYDYANLGDGFAQAMDLTLGGFVDGSMTADDGLRYMMTRDASWVGVGGAVDPLVGGAAAAGSEAGGGGGGGSGGFGF